MAPRGQVSSGNGEVGLAPIPVDEPAAGHERVRASTAVRGARDVRVCLRDIEVDPERWYDHVEDVEDEKTAGPIRRRDRAVRGRGGGRVAEHRRLVIDLGRPAEALRCRQTDRAALGGAVFAVDADEWSETKQASLESGGLTAEGRRRRRGARRRGGQPESGGEEQGHAE